MAALPFRHVSRADLWSRCDFDRLRIEPATETVRLATREAADGRGAVLAPAAFDAILARVGGAVLVPCGPGACGPGAVALADPVAGDLLRLAPDGWRSLAAPAPAPEAGPFVPRGASPGGSFAPAALQRDVEGRLWLWDRATNRLLAMDAPTLSVLAEVAPPAGVSIGGLAVWRRGVAIADAAAPRLFVRALAGEWSTLPGTAVAGPTGLADPLSGHVPVAGSGHPDGAGYFVVRPAAGGPSRLVVLDAAGARAADLPALEDPLFLLGLSGGVLIGEAAPVAGHDRLHLFRRYRILPDGSLSLEATYAARSFDGRAIYEHADGALFATTAAGARPLAIRAANVSPEGVLETYALDSGVYGCAWHRVFLDACLPRNTALTAFAKTADTLPPEALRRAPRPPLDYLAPAAAGGEPQAVTDAWAALPLGSEAPDETEGWVPLGTLERRGGLADRPFHDEAAALCSEDPLPRAAGPEPIPVDTLEGLLKTPPGRYLWLRVVFTGHQIASPALRAARVTFRRPSLLDRLPAYWRADAAVAEVTDRALALFEGFDTEAHGRVDAIPRLLDPANCPAAALDWLAGFVGLVFDTRLSEAVRRQLLLEATWLYRFRGTVPAMERLCAILSRAEVQVVDGFRLRASGGIELGERRTYGDGAPRGVLGRTLRLGTGEGGAAEDWEAELRLSFEDLARRRAAVREAGETPCPPADPGLPLDDRPPIPSYRRHAHRFTVVIMRPKKDALADVLDTAIEFNKPAHTLHRLCFLDAGFRVGVTTYAGIGTRFGEPDAFRPGILGWAEVGGRHTLSEDAGGATRAGFFVGSTRQAARGAAGTREPGHATGELRCH